MKKLLIAALVTVSMLTFAAIASAALRPGVYDPGNTGCPKATYAKGVLHLEKNCDSSVNAAAGADITGAEGQAFTSASFTLASASQCQGGSPRFNVDTTAGFYFLGCNNVVPTINADGTATYLFNAATLAAGGQQVATPTGNIKSVSILIDIQGKADLTNITLNGKKQKVTKRSTGLASAPCRNGGWKTFTSPTFKNQGQCVKHLIHARNAARRG
jgi:hypothetical protein